MHQLTILHQNMQEISNKINRLNHLLEETNPDVIILSEHGLKLHQLENTRLANYCLKSYFCRENHKKGGVAIFVKEGLEGQHVQIENSEELTLEMGMVKITLKKKILYILGVYRTPAGHINEGVDLLSATIEESKAENYPTIIMGDINVDSLKNDRNNQMLNNMLSSHNITRLPLPPTRITPTSATSIDCICTNLDKDLIKSTVINAGISDHTAQLCEVKITHNPSNQNRFSRRKFNKENLNLLRAQLEKVDWTDVHSSDSPETAYKNFLSTIIVMMNATCPRKHVLLKRKKNQSVYSNEESKHLKEAYLQRLCRYELTGAEADKTEMNNAKKDYDLKLKTLRRQATANHIARAENKSKALWQIINSERKCQNSGTPKPQLKIAGKITTNPEQISNQLNHFFANIAEQTLSSQPRTQNIKTNHLPTTNHDLNQLPLTNEQEICAIIRNLKPKTSAGLDEISAKTLKHCSKALVPPLVSITNLSLAHGHFPSLLKQSKVYPKFKGGDQTEASNYRPISLISTFSKVIEKVVLKRLMDHCELHSLLTENQHGFVKGRSTTSAIIKLAEFIIDALEDRNAVTGIMLDFSKAFDCLGHELILRKLELLGIKGQARAWFESYLEGRSQVVEIRHQQNGVTQETRSKPLPMNRGVPQGSVLGPVLFILLTNDMPQYLGTHCSPLMYADDTTLLVSKPLTDDLAVSSYIALHMAYQYCHENDLVVNIGKTKQLGFGKRHAEVPALPDVKMESHTTFLGVTIDSKLQWDEHVDALTKKLNSSLYALKRIKNTSDAATTKIAYHALFESHIRYSLIVWGGTSAQNLNRILVLQKRAIRTMSEPQLGYRDSCRDEFPKQKILTLISLYIKEVIVFVVEENQQRGQDTHQHNTRHASNFTLAPHHTSRFEKKPSYIGRKLFNVLPDDMKVLKGNELKRTLTRWLLDRPFYSLDEFLGWRNGFNQT
jgi:hypothetical protein